MDTEFDVAVVGAGVAGLAAFEALERAGLNTVLLEARARVGGRILTFRDPLSSIPIELGAEFIHGRPAEIWDIVRDANLAVFDCTDASRYLHDGKVERNADAWLMVDSLLDDMRRAAGGGDQTFEQFLHSTDYDEDTKRTARLFIEGFNAAKSDAISIQALAEETTAADQINGDRSFRFAGGYEAVAQHLLTSVANYQTKLRLNTVVERVEWKRDEAVVEANGKTFRARRVVVSVPLGVLQADAIHFEPEPKEILEAAKRIQFGQAYRVVMRFREPFWEQREELADAGFLLSRREYFPTWWTSLAMRSKLLTGWSAGARAEGLLGMKREEIIARALESLASITGFSEETIEGQLENVYLHDWHADPLARGAYSFVPAGALEARKRLGVPVEGTLFFAGEATDQGGHSATVHGAIASGRRSARQILEATGLAAKAGF